MMACIAQSCVMESCRTVESTMRMTISTRRSQRALFHGSNGILFNAERTLEDENKDQQINHQNPDHGSEQSGSESEYEPSDASDSDVSNEDIDVVEITRIDFKRKRTRASSPSTKQSCRWCGQGFASIADTKAHETLPHPFVCDIEGCGRCFADETVAIQHVDVWHGVHENERFVCATCDTFCLTLHDLDQHCHQTTHELHEPPQKLFVCTSVPSCRQAYKKRDKLIQHIRRLHTPHADGTPFECERCDVTMAKRYERQQHLDTAHPGHSTAVSTPCFVCEFVDCGKSYSKREHLKRHILATHEAPLEKPFGCILCGVRFVYKHALGRHHTNCHTTDVEKPYSCSVCLLAFKKKSLLQAHSFVHTGVEPFECEDCGERFLKRFQLTRHARKHINAKPSQAQVFMCEHDDCDELLFSMEEKYEHMREVHGLDLKEELAPSKSKGSHSNRRSSRELRCLVCDQTFARIQNLRSHLRTHFEALDARKLHACPMVGCDKAYTKKSNLMAHYNAIHDPIKSKRFKCPYDGCDGAFGYKKVLQTHIASIHEKSTVKVKDEVYNGSDSEDEHITKKRKGREAKGVLSRVLGA